MLGPNVLLGAMRNGPARRSAVWRAGVTTTPLNACVRHRPAVQDQVHAVSPDWKSVECRDVTAAEQGAENVSNAMRPSVQAAHLDIFHSFTPHRGTISNRTLTDFVGFVAPFLLYCNAAYMKQPVAHAIRTRQCELHHSQHMTPAAVVQTAWPVVSEEYFEYADILESVEHYQQSTAGATAPRSYSFVELGCGYGHWAFAAWAALKQKLGLQAPHKMLLVDVVDSHSTIAELIALNGADPSSFHFHLGWIGGADASAARNASEPSTAAVNAAQRYQISRYARSVHPTNAVPSVSD